MKIKLEKDIKKEAKKSGARAAYQGSQSDCRRRPSDWTTEGAAFFLMLNLNSNWLLSKISRQGSVKLVVFRSLFAPGWSVPPHTP